jgi:hypothetical protein
MRAADYTRFDADWDSWYGETIPFVFKITVEQALEDGELSVNNIEDTIFWLKKANAHQPLIDVFQRLFNNYEENLSIEAEDNRP